MIFEVSIVLKTYVTTVNTTATIVWDFMLDGHLAHPTFSLLHVSLGMMISSKNKICLLLSQ